MHEVYVWRVAINRLQYSCLTAALVVLQQYHLQRRRLSATKMSYWIIWTWKARNRKLQYLKSGDLEKK